MQMKAHSRYFIVLLFNCKIKWIYDETILIAEMQILSIQMLIFDQRLVGFYIYMNFSAYAIYDMVYTIYWLA